MKSARNDGTLLAGVCAGIARTFHWNVWALRAIFVIFLMIKTLWAVAAYVGLALLFYLLGGEWAERRKSSRGLQSPELSVPSRRISELERRFEQLERGG